MPLRARARCPQRGGRKDNGGQGQQDKGGREQQVGLGRSPRTTARRQRGATHRDLKRPEALAEDNQGIVRNELAQNLAPHLTNIPHTGQGVSPVCTPQPGAAAAAAAAFCVLSENDKTPQALRQRNFTRTYATNFPGGPAVDLITVDLRTLWEANVGVDMGIPVSASIVRASRCRGTWSTHAACRAR